MLAPPPTSAPSFARAIARLVAFDLRRFRVAIAVSVGLELLRAALAEWVLHRGPVLAGTAFSGTSAEFELQTLGGAAWLAVAITTAMLVQADHPADDRAFLGSRPIVPWSIAVAKLTTLAGLAALLPFLATAARLLAYGAPVASIAASAVQFIAIGGAVVLPAWALAIAARTLPRFLAGVGALAMLWSVAVTTIVSLGPRGPFPSDLVDRVTNWRILHTFAPPLADWQAVDRHGWMMGAAMTLFATGILASFYRTRRAIASVLAGAALLAAPVIIPAPRAWRPAAPDLVAAATSSARLPALVIPSTALMAKLHGDDVLVFGDVVLPALPTNVSVDRALGPVHLTAAGIDVRSEGLQLYGHDAARASAAAAQVTERAWSPEPDAEMLFSLPRRDVETLRGRRVNVDTAVDLRFTRHVLVADLPLRPGAAFRTDDYLVEVLSVEVETGFASALCRFTRFPSLARTRTPLMAFVGHPTRLLRPQPGPGFEPGFLVDGRVGWARGRTWTRQMRVAIPDLAALDAPPRLRLVESRPAGEARVALAARDVPIRTREPRPVPPSMPIGLR